MQFPLYWLERLLQRDLQTGWKGLALKLLLTGLWVLVCYIAYLWADDAIRRSRRRRRRAAELDGQKHMDPSSTSETPTVGQGAPALSLTELKREGAWDRLGEAYDALGRHQEAAKAYLQAGDQPRAARQWLKAGKEKKAARLLEQAGLHEQAARIHLERRRFRQAVRVLKSGGKLAEAAAYCAQQGNYKEAAKLFQECLNSAMDHPEQQKVAAKNCYECLGTEKARAALKAEELRSLWLAAAQRLDGADADELAANLFREAGEFGRAGDIYLRLDRLEEAAQCLLEAGRVQEANAVHGRFFESQGRLREAALAYEKGGVWLRAGDCHSKTNEPERAAACYEKGGEFFGAGFALVHAGEWEKAVALFQKVPETAPRYEESRGLLGRCFYEMKDFAHCAAALENHLTGAKVMKATISYFWMLALAYEQMGELEKSRATLRKIRAVDMSYRDVTQRLSSIESRLSMLGDNMTRAASSPSPSPASAAPGAEVAQMVENALGRRYAIERELGRGGMGVVYLARDTQLERPVALKFLGAAFDNSKEFRERFLREAKAAARVSHPNIIGIYDIGGQQGSVYIAMEYVEGANLTRYVADKGRLPLRESVNIVLQVCAALDAIHQQHIVHRDIKPDNILIARGGLVKVMDFGLALMENARLTSPGMVMGTPYYMAPEQVLAEETDARTDIYSLGLVLYELLTGRSAFSGGDVFQKQVDEMPPSPRQVAPDVPEALERVVMSCIAKKPSERHPSAAALAAALRGAASRT